MNGQYTNVSNNQFSKINLEVNKSYGFEYDYYFTYDQHKNVLGGGFNPFVLISTKKITYKESNLVSSLKGKLLLQVEAKGAIWYVNPADGKRYSVTFANALPLFRKLSLGISNADLAKISVAKSGQTGSSSTGNRLKGKLLLQVEQGGAIWYVDQNGYRHSVTWDNLLPLFQSLSLGITNDNLNKISEGSLN